MQQRLQMSVLVDDWIIDITIIIFAVAGTAIAIFAMAESQRKFRTIQVRERAKSAQAKTDSLTTPAQFPTHESHE
jgi:uncharacterized protein YpmB